MTTRRIALGCLLMLGLACNSGGTSVKDAGAGDAGSVAGPAVSLVASQTSVTTAGSINLLAAATGPAAIFKVEFYEGTEKLGDAAMAPYMQQVSFTAADNGSHTYFAKAIDVATRTGVSAEVTVVVNIQSGTGGGTAATGGGTAGTGGGAAGTGGGEVGTGGGTAGTGGGTAGTGGGTAGTGGGTAGTGGGAAGTGGGAAGTGGGTAGTGGGTAGTGGGTAGTGGGSGETVPPVVSLGASVNTVTTAMTVTLTAVATDNVGVAKVELYEGFTKRGETNTRVPNTNNYLFPLNLTAADNGLRVFYARAYDAAANTADSSAVTLNVNIALPSAIAEIYSGNGFTYVRKNSGSLFVAGTNATPIGGSAFPLFSPFYGVTAKTLGFGPTASAVLFVKNDDSVVGVGSNSYGLLGNSAAGPFTTPTATTPPLTGAKQVFAGEYHSCVVKLDGTLWCFGYQYLGNGVSTGNAVPQQAIQPDGGILTDVDRVSVGYVTTVVLKNDGTVYAFGNGGEVGDGTGSARAYATAVINADSSPLTGVVDQCSGRNYAVATLGLDAGVVAWGQNPYGQLGDGTASTRRLSAWPVVGLSDVVQVSCGAGHVLALKADNTVWSWGNNNYGQLGNGTNTGFSNVPVQVLGLSNVKRVTAGENNSFALKHDGTLWAWGQPTATGITDAGYADITSPRQVWVP